MQMSEKIKYNIHMSRTAAKPFLLLPACLFALILSNAFAIEIPLDNFGKSTKVAYVSMHKIFEAFPETEKARIELNRLIDERKAEITAKKEEIALLKGEIAFLRKQMSAVAPSAAPKTLAPHILPPPDQAAAPTQAEGGITGLTSLTLPPGSPLGFIFTPPAESTATPRETETQVPGRTSSLPTVSTSAPAILPGIPSPAPQLKEKETVLAQKESEMEIFIGVAEDDVKKMEEGKTMTLFARIYKAMEEIAGKEGYSVIVDKDNILYGENAVDITQAVIWRLSAPGTKRKS